MYPSSPACIPDMWHMPSPGTHPNALQSRSSSRLTPGGSPYPDGAHQGLIDAIGVHKKSSLSLGLLGSELHLDDGSETYLHAGSGQGLLQQDSMQSPNLWGSQDLQTLSPPRSSTVVTPPFADAEHEGNPSASAVPATSTQADSGRFEYRRSQYTTHNTPQQPAADHYQRGDREQPAAALMYSPRGHSTYDANHMPASSSSSVQRGGRQMDQAGTYSSDEVNHEHAASSHHMSYAQQEVPNMVNRMTGLISPDGHSAVFTDEEKKDLINQLQSLLDMNKSNMGRLESIRDQMITAITKAAESALTRIASASSSTGIAVPVSSSDRSKKRQATVEPVDQPTSKRKEPPRKKIAKCIQCTIRIRNDCTGANCFNCQRNEWTCKPLTVMNKAEGETRCTRCVKINKWCSGKRPCSSCNDLEQKHNCVDCSQFEYVEWKQ